MKKKKRYVHNTWSPQVPTRNAGINIICVLIINFKDYVHLYVNILEKKKMVFMRVFF